MRQFYITGIAAGTLALLLSGCSSKTNAPVAPVASTTVAPQQMQAIQNNPKLSPQMKASFKSGQ